MPSCALYNKLKNQIRMKACKKMNLRKIYHSIVFTIFTVQAFQSLNKYFQYPIVYQESSTTFDTIEKPTVQVCFPNFFDFSKSKEFGYEWKTNLLTGMIPNTTRPSWKGLNGNLTFQRMRRVLYDKDFSKVDINTQSRLKYILLKGFCLQANSIIKELTITSKERDLDVFLVHKSTDTRIILDMHSRIDLRSTSVQNFDSKTYTISYEILDNSIHDGKTCKDYRKQEETYGDCNYRVIKAYLVSFYGCYLPWMDEAEGKECEVDVAVPVMKSELQKEIFKDIWDLSSGIKINLLKQCVEPCYQVKVKWEETEITTWNKYTRLAIYDNVKSVRTQKAVYSFDIFMLTVELGSALSLWLGM